MTGSHEWRGPHPRWQSTGHSHRGVEEDINVELHVLSDRGFFRLQQQFGASAGDNQGALEVEGGLVPVLDGEAQVGQLQLLRVRHAQPRVLAGKEQRNSA